MEWRMQQAKLLGISGVTTFAGVESIGSHSRRHSARFFELTDQPIEIMMAVSQDQATRLFYIKTPIECGELGRQIKEEERPAGPASQ